METRGRTIGDWLEDIQRGFVQLPRFQRKNVWKHGLVEGFLDAIRRERPLGVFLVLEVDPHHQPFKIRPIRGAPNGSERCRQHLLDGQQRLTALWEVFNRDRHETHAFYLTFEEVGAVLRDTGVEAVSRSGRHRSVVGDAVSEYNKRWIPAHVLAPTDDGVTNRLEWLEAAMAGTDDQSARQRFHALVERLRMRISNTQIPFFSLPQDTPADDAIQIFIETNRSSVKLSHYELAVAQMEEKTKESLEDQVRKLCKEVPTIEELEGREIGDLVLKVQCLREGRKPTLSNYGKLNFRHLQDGWRDIVAGVRWTTDLLADMFIWSEDRLPTAVPLRVLPPLRASMPASGTALAAATKLAKRYLWAAFLTDRYDRQANARLQVDHEWLKDRLRANGPVIDLPDELNQSPTDDAIRTAGWPRQGGRLGRAVLAACSLGGARDIASNKQLAPNGTTEYHHIFPKAVLKRTDEDPDLALNCMLLHTPTNRHWSDKLPGDFLIETIRQSTAANRDTESELDAESEVKERLETHLAPAHALLRVREGFPGVDVAAAYKQFMHDRTEQVQSRVADLLRKGEL